MTDHKTGTRQEWLAARADLLAHEKELTRLGDTGRPSAQGAALGSSREGVHVPDCLRT